MFTHRLVDVLIERKDLRDHTKAEASVMSIKLIIVAATLEGCMSEQYRRLKSKLTEAHLASQELEVCIALKRTRRR